MFLIYLTFFLFFFQIKLMRRKYVISMASIFRWYEEEKIYEENFMRDLYGTNNNHLFKYLCQQKYTTHFLASIR